MKKIITLLMLAFFVGCSASPDTVKAAKERAKTITEQSWTVKRIEAQPSGGNSAYWVHFIFVGENGERILIKRMNNSPAAVDYFRLIEGDTVTFKYEEPATIPWIPTPVTFLKLILKSTVLPEQPSRGK